MVSTVRSFAALLVAVAALVSACGSERDAPVAETNVSEDSIVTEPPSGPQLLLDKQELTVLDQRVTYPKKKPARISSETVVLQPGEQTGWRRHKIPVYVHVLSGTYTVDYGEGALVEYPAGTAFMQATKTDYNGSNVGEEPLEVLHVYLGAKGLRDVIER